MKKKFTVLLSLVLVLSLFLGFGAPVRAEEKEEKEITKEGGVYGGTLVIRASGDPMSFIPSLAADDNAYPIVQNMFNRLTKLDASKNPIPDAAESWDISEDALTITFHLKEGIKWWDGESLDAEDVKYTFDYIKNEPAAYFSSSMDIVDEIEVVDPLTVVFHMNQADVSFVARIGWYATFIMPKHIFDNGDKWEDNPAAMEPVGSGPFMLEEFRQGESVSIVKNPDYFEGEPYLDKVIFSIIPDDTTAVQALLNGEVDYIEMVPPAFFDQLSADENFRLDRNFYPSPWRYIFNLQAEEVQDVAIRQAIAHCIDREDISAKVTNDIMPPEYSAYPSMVEWVANTEDVYPGVDIDKARAILEEAGYEADADGYYVRGLTVDVFEGDLVDMTRLVIANAEKAGIEIKMLVSEFNAWSEKVHVGGDWMIEAQGGFMGPDPAALYSRYGGGPENGSNYASYDNSEFDELCKKAAAEGDQEERAKLYREAQALLIRDLPAINVVGFAAWEVADARLKNLPIDGEGLWGWAEYTFTYFDDVE